MIIINHDQKRNGYQLEFSDIGGAPLAHSTIYQTKPQAKAALEKIINYIPIAKTGSWQNFNDSAPRFELLNEKQKNYRFTLNLAYELLLLSKPFDSLEGCKAGIDLLKNIAKSFSPIDGN